MIHAIGEKQTLKYNYQKELVPNAQILRKNMTPEEKHLWYDFLKRLPMTVNRQKNIGHYIVDFYISSADLVIEIDGRQHKLPENREADKQRDDDLRMLGNVVLRYSNEDIHRRFNSVCEEIMKQLDIGMDDLKPVKR